MPFATSMAKEQKTAEKADSENGFCLENQLWYQQIIECLKKKDQSFQEDV